MQSETRTSKNSINWARIQAWVQVVLMYLLAIYFVDLSRPGGNLDNYINVQNLAWLTWVGAGILFLLALSSTLELMRPSTPPPDHDDTHDHPQDHDHEHHHTHEGHDHHHAAAGSLQSWLFLGLAAIPLLLGLGLPSQPLGADAITGEISADVTSLSFSGGTAAVAEIPPENRNILDWLRVFSTTPDLQSLQGERVSALGFIYQDARFLNTDRFMVVRFTLSCCVADARPIGLVVQSAEGAALPQDTWVQLSGTVDIQVLDGVETPVIVPDRLEVTSAPDQPYLYF